MSVAGGGEPSVPGAPDPGVGRHLRLHPLPQHLLAGPAGARPLRPGAHHILARRAGRVHAAALHGHQSAAQVRAHGGRSGQGGFRYIGSSVVVERRCADREVPED